METLKVRRNNFWIKLICFFYCCDNNNWILPSDTCSLRKLLLIGIPIGILILPVILSINIIQYFTKEKLVSFRNDLFLPYFLGILFSLSSVFLFHDFFIKSYGILGFMAQSYFFTFCFILLFGMFAFLFFFLAFIVMKTWEFSLSRKPGLIKELYDSAKEKYCKKIEYVD